MATTDIGEQAATKLPRERTFVVGTAGHVDHGKSTLVKVLTGIDPDRLQEEREREMTIDLGFAWLLLPDGINVSIVDVPGHERFIKNMLAGVGGIDAALLVIAADEGPMPQTSEHLAILDLLEIERGIVVLTKRDLVDDEWLELVTEETRERLIGTVLEDAPIVPVSSTTREGLDDLVARLTATLDAMPERTVSGNPRLPVDRSFSVAGFGTVVTGTLVGGALEVGQEVEILPRGLRARVRGLQSHGRKVERSLPGARTAVNLSGVERDDIRRGDVLTVPGWLRPTTMLDVRLRIIRDTGGLEQNDPVDLFIGSSEALGHVTLLDREHIPPGDEGWVQVRLSQPIVAAAGDRFIIRQPSPSLTIGGGQVIDAHPRRHRRFRPDVIQGLETRARGTPAERLVQILSRGLLDVRAVAEELGQDLDETRSVITEVIDGGDIVALGIGRADALPPNRLITSSTRAMELTRAVTELLEDFHRRQRLRRGMPKEEVRSRLGLSGREFDALLQTMAGTGLVEDHGSLVSLPGHVIRLTAEEQEAAGRFIAALRERPVAPPSPDTFGITPDMLAALVEMGEIVRVQDSVVFGAAQLAELRRETLRLIDEHGSITLGQFRDHFGSSRKYAQAVLEYFDQQRITRRVGDTRVRGTV